MPLQPQVLLSKYRIEDVPIQAVDVLFVVITQKLKKKVDEIPLSKTIKDLVGGKSTMQNEILGDLQQGFASAPEKGEELPLEEVGSALGTGFNGNLGKYSTGLVSRLVGRKMPASTIKSYLAKTWANALRCRSLAGTTLEPPKRLSSEAEAKAWLDNVVLIYSQRAGNQLSSGGAAGSCGGSNGGVINSEECLKFQAEQNKFAAQQIDLYMRYFSRGSRVGELAFDKERSNTLVLQARLDSNTREHGDAYLDGIQPRFDPLKARHFESSWNWARQDPLLMYYDIIHGNLKTIDREITARCIAILNRADPDLLRYMQYHIDRCDPSKGETYKLAKEFGLEPIKNAQEVFGKPPLYKDGKCRACFFLVIIFSTITTVTLPTAPRTVVTEKGEIKYTVFFDVCSPDYWRKVETSSPNMSKQVVFCGPQRIQSDRVGMITKSQDY